MLLKVENLNTFYGNLHAIWDIDIEVDNQEIVALIGSNGAGKSTLLKTLAGSIPLKSGRVEYEGEVISEKRMHSSALVKKGIILCPEGRHIFPRMSVEENLKMGGYTRKKTELTESYEKVYSLFPRLEERKRQLAGTLSGGELQRVALTVALSKEADFYFLDEVTPFLDIYQRMIAAKLIRELAESHPVILVEHDIAILDMVAETVHIAYGKPAAFGIITRPKGVRIGVNQYLEGFVAEENVRIRDYPVVFETRGHESDVDREILMEIPEMTKTFPGFTLKVAGGEVRRGEVLGIVGANGIGKSTFAKLLAGVETPDDGKKFDTVTVSYKPQYVTANTSDTVEFLLRQATRRFDSSYYQHEILEPLGLMPLLQSEVNHLSGGELQRVAIALCLSRDADLYILDEPSAHLDVEQRLVTTKVIKRAAEDKGAGIMVIDHDMYTIDMISERLLVFDGVPGANGLATGPFEMKEGMNKVLGLLGITFRRDKTGRPRINKPGSYLDREQKAAGEYYYYNLDMSALSDAEKEDEDETEDSDSQ